MLKILIVDNDYTYIELLFNEIALRSNQEFKVVGLFNDGKNAINYVLNNSIDILITELELPHVSGVEIIEQAKKINPNVSIVALSKDPNQIINIVNKDLYIDKMFIKPFNIKELFNFLNTLNKKETKTNKIVMDLLKDFNYNQNTLGYLFIVDGLSLCIEKNCSYIKTMKDLYAELEERYNGRIPAQKIYWNVSKAVLTMNESTDITILNKYFPYNGNPSPKSFFNEMLLIYHSM